MMLMETPTEDILNEYRKRIDELDAQLLAILAERRQIVMKIGEYKKQKGLPPLDPKRWEQVLQSKTELAKDLDVSPDFIRELYNLIHEYSLSLEEAVAKRPEPPAYQGRHVSPVAPTLPMVLGIQGGRGSFNEEAAKRFAETHGITDYRLQYLYTSPAVMEALCRGDITRGQCAIYNSTGGYVEETVNALKEYPVEVVDEFAIQISHTLMLHQDAALSDIDTIMCHPQVFAQCKQTLELRYPHLKQVSGTGDLLDTAKVAEALSEGKLPKSVAVLGPKVLAEIYGFRIADDNLQDLKENYTRFIHVEKRI
jgi:chorismate mutase/prephenate dehydratase